MFLRRRLRPCHPGAWLLLWLGGLTSPQLAAMVQQPSAGETHSGPDAAGLPDGSALTGFEQWVQELKQHEANPELMAEGRGVTAITELRMPTLPTSLRIFTPGSRAGARYINLGQTKGKTIQQTAQVIHRAQADVSLHPFFAVRGDERVGKVSRFFISSGPGRTEQPPRELNVSPVDELAWIADSGCGYQWLTPEGSHHSMINSNRQVRHLHFAGSLSWQLGKAWVFATEVSDAAWAGLDLPRPLEKGSRQPVGSDRADLFVPMPRTILHLHLEEAGPGSQAAIKAEYIPGTEETCNARLMPNRAGTVLVHARPDQPFLYVRRVGDEVGARVGTASGGMPVCLVQGTGAEVWFIQTRPFGIGCIDTETMKVVHHLPEGLAAKVQEPHAAAFGPDGNLWFTDPKGCQIGRVIRRERDGAPAGEVSLFDLGKGQHPEELVCSKGAWLFFTVKDQAVIGSIRAVDARPEEACGAFVPRRPQEPIERPEAGAAARPRRKLSGAQRRKRRMESERVATATPTKDPQGDAAGSPAAAPTPEPSAVETKACIPVAPPSASLAGKAPGGSVSAPVAAVRPLDPLKRLEAMYVRVDEKRIEEHILIRHAAQSKAKASKFAPQYSTKAGLLRLLADQLDGAEIGRELRVDRERNFYTTCRQPRVGQCNDQETGIFTVVTRMEWNKDTREWWHKLVTVFPGE